MSIELTPAIDAEGPASTGIEEIAANLLAPSPYDRGALPRREPVIAWRVWSNTLR